VAGRLDYLGNELTLGGLDVAQGAIRGLMSGKGVSKGIEEERASSRREAEQLGTAEKLAYGVLGAVPMAFGGPLSWGAKGAAMAARSAPSVARAGTALAQAAQTAKATMPPALASAASKLVPQSAVGQGIARGAAEGAAYGGIEGALRGTGAGEGALTGAALGSALGGAGAGISKALTKPKVAAAPAAGDLLSEADALFNKARSGFTYINPDAADRIRDKMRQSVRTFSSDPRLMPNTQDILKNQIGARGTGMTVEQLDDLRQILGREAKAQRTGMYDRDSAGLISMRSALMDEISALKPKDITGAIAQGANRLGKIENLQEGIKTWSRGKKAQTISKLIEDSGITAGKYSQSGAENALRTKFRQLAENKREMNYYTPQEQAMIRQAAKGTISRNMLRKLGKFAPDDLVKGLPYMFTGPIGIPLAAAAWGARLGARRTAEKEAQDILGFVSRGGPGQPLPVSDLRKALAQDYVDPTRRLLTYGLLGQ